MKWVPERRERIARGLFFLFERLVFADGDGQEVIRDIIRHPGGVSVLPIHGDQVTLIRQYRAPLDRWLLETPAGKMNPGEDPEVAARRECIEEVGLEPGELIDIGPMESSPGFTDEIIHLFLAFDAIPTDIDPDGPEEHHAEIVTMSLAEALHAVDVGEISDSKTRVLLLTAARRNDAGTG